MAEGTEDANRRGRGPETSVCWDRQEFAARVQESYRTFWLIGVSVLGRREGVEDVLQEAAVVALRKPEQFRPGTSFRAWMGQIVRFVALNHLRRNRREGPAGSTAPALELATAPQAAGEPYTVITDRGELVLGQSAFDDEVTRALGELSEMARACLLLRTVEGMEYTEIAAVLDIPEGTAMSHVHRSRQAMRRRLESWGRHGRKELDPTSHD